MAPHKALKKDVKRLQAKHRSSPKIPRRPDSQPLSALLAARPPPTIPLSLHQAVLDTYCRAFPTLLSAEAVAEESLDPVLQEVKGHLYNRDFETAFGKLEYLEAYAIRWSAGRSLGYLKIFQDVLMRLPQLERVARRQGDDELEQRLASSLSLTNPSGEPATVQITNLGGGAGAELCALAGLLHDAQHPSSNPREASLLDPDLHFSVDLIDIADWSRITSTLHESLTTPPPLSAYASASAKAQNTAFVPAAQLTTTFHHLDLLSPALSEDAKVMAQAMSSADLVTLMFTLNELYSTSVPKTQKMLLDITACVKEGTLLLVVDSPGSYSTVSLNGREKKYPMAWLLDHTLLNIAANPPLTKEEPEDAIVGECSDVVEAETATEKEKEKEKVQSAPTKRAQPPPPAWQKLTDEESAWFRLPEVDGRLALKYPLDLENMRYQMHLYRRLGASDLED